MPKTVEFPELGAIDFPDEMSWDDVQKTIEDNRQSIHQSLFDRRTSQMAVETNKESEPPGIGDRYVQTIRSIGKGAISGVAGLSKAIGEGAAFVNRQVYNGGEPGTVRSGNPNDLTTYKLGKGLQDAANEASPDIPGLEDSFLFNDVPSGIGQVGGALVTGGGAGALVKGGAAKLGVQGAAKLGTQAAVRLGLTEMAGSEFDDAYQRAIDRGDSPDLATGKATAYSVLATAIESKLGFGRIAKRFGLGGPMKEMEAAAKEGLAKVAIEEAAAGFTEEALQRAAQDYIVDGKLDVNAVAREGGAGAVVQALMGAVGHAGRRKHAQAALNWISQAQANGVTKEELDATGFTPETAKELGIHVLEAPTEGGDLDTTGSGGEIVIKDLPNLNPPPAESVVKDSLTTGDSAVSEVLPPGSDGSLPEEGATIKDPLIVAQESDPTIRNNRTVAPPTDTEAQVDSGTDPESVDPVPPGIHPVAAQLHVRELLGGKVPAYLNIYSVPGQRNDRGALVRGVNQDGTIHINVGNLGSTDEVSAVLLHEGFHNIEQFPEIQDSLRRLAKTASETDLRELANRGYGESEAPLEAVAQILEREYLTAQQRNAWQKLWEHTKGALQRTLGWAGVKFNSVDARRILAESIRSLQTQDETGAPKFSLSRETVGMAVSELPPLRRPDLGIPHPKTAAGKAAVAEGFKRIYGTTITAADGVKVFIGNKRYANPLTFLTHLVRENKTGAFNADKAEWLPMLKYSLEHAQLRALDQDGTRIYLTRYEGPKPVVHLVMVTPEGNLKSFGAGSTTFLQTQFGVHGNNSRWSWLVEWKAGKDALPGSSSRPDPASSSPGSDTGGQSQPPTGAVSGQPKFALGPVAPSPQQGERQHGQKIRETSKLDDTIKERIDNWLYHRRSNADDAAFATRLVHELGLPGATDVFRDDRNGLPEAVRTMLGHAIVTAYGQVERQARIDGKISQANQIAEKAAAFVDQDVLPRSTSIAQALQAYAAFARLTPAGWLATTKRMVEKARGNRLVVTMPTLVSALDRMRSINAEVVDQVGTSPAVQAAAANALDASVVAAPEIEWVVRQEAAKRFGGLQELILDHFSGRNPGKTLAEKLALVYKITPEKAQAKAARVEAAWKKEVSRYQGQAKAKLKDQRALWRQYQSAIAGEVVAAVRSKLKGPTRGAALEGFSDRVAAVLRAHVEKHFKATPGRPAPKLSAAQVIGEALKNPEKYQEAWTTSLDALRDEFSGQPEVLQRLEEAIRQRPDLIAEAPLEQAIAKKFRELRLKMGHVVRQHYIEEAATSRKLSDRLVQEAGVQGEAALRLASAVQAKFSQLASERKRAELERMVKSGSNAVIKRKDVAQRIIELSNLGGFANRPALEAIAEKMDLPSFTEEAAKEVTRMASELQQLPADSHMQKAATVKMMNFIARQGGMRWWELPMAMWYANTLAGPVTHAINAGSNLISMAGNMSSVLVRRPTDTLGALAAAADGFRRGAPEALSVLKTGINTRAEKLEALGTLELVRDKDLKGLGAVLNKWRYVGRALAASDQLFYYGNREVYAALAARGLARQEGLTGKRLQARVREILGTDTESKRSAEAQATAEGLAGLDYARRVNELMDQARPAELNETSDQWALRATFNNKPYGLLGAVAEGVNLINRKTVVTRLAVPFVNVVANVTNESLNYSPVGFVRAAWAQWNLHRGGSATLYGQDITDKEMIYDAYAKAAVGTAMVGALVSLAAKGLGDDDWWFGLSGQGPADAGRRKALRETGWIPYSIRIKDRYFNYANTPLAVPLAIGGNYLDAMKHGNLAQTDALNRVAFAMATAGHVITQQSFLDSLAQLFGALDHINERKAWDRGVDVVARAVTTIAVPNALRQIDRMFDPRMMEPMTAQERVTAQIPFVRRNLKPALNALGEPVMIAPLDRLVSGTRNDELWLALAKVGAAPAIPEQGLLTPEEHYDLVEYRASILRPKLEAALGKIASSTPAEARRIVNGITSEATSSAKRALGLEAVEKARKAEAQ